MNEWFTTEWRESYEKGVLDWVPVYAWVPINRGIVRSVAENGSGWRCEVVAHQVHDPGAGYSVLVSMLTPINHVHGFNTPSPHDDYIREKFFGSREVGGAEFALVATSIRDLLGRFTWES